MLSLITIARDRREQLRALVEGARQMRPRPFELVVVDMGGPEITPRCDGLPLRVVDFRDAGEELPLAAARNRGAAAARGCLLLFLDVDCIPGRDLAGEMRAGLHRRGGLVMANVRYLEKGFRDDGQEAIRLAASSPDPLRADLGDRVPPELFGATAFGVRRRDFDRLGGFCEDYVGYGGEDADLGLTAARAGFPISRWRTALAYHQWHPSPDPPLQHVASIVHNAEVFHDRWGQWPMQDWLEAFDELGIVEYDPDADVLELSDRLARR